MNSVRIKRVRLQGDQDSTGELIHNDIEGEQRIQVRRRKRGSKKRYVLIGMLVLLVLMSTGSSVAGFLMYHTYNARYHTDLSLAQTGTQHLQKAEALLGTWSKRPLDTQLTSQAEIEFASAFKTFGQLNNDLRSLPGFIKQIPSYGTRLNAALHLVPLAITLSQAGTTGCNILHILGTGLRDPLTPQGHGITLSDLAVVTQDVQKLKASLAMATQQVSQLQPGDMQVDARIPRLVSAFHKGLPVIQDWLDTFERLIPVAPSLLGIGTPANYLIEVLDSTELRPAGGFIGNYGVATLSGGRLSAAHITDVDLIDKPFESAGHVIPYPPAYGWFDLAPGSWSFRDSNLDADFPTAARYGEQTYREEGGKVPIQGVIAIAPALIERALAITGPITVPEYHETVTAQNLIARIHFHQLGGRAAGEGSDLIPSPDGHSSLRKRFTELLAEHFLAHVHQLAPSQLSKFVLLMVNAVHSKDLQLYLNSAVAENLLHRFQLDAAIQSPVGDSLFVVDANIAPNKANNFIINTLDDRMTIDNQGDVIHHATLHYAWTIAGQNYGSPLYRDFVHIYVPPGSELLKQDGWQPRGTSNAFNRKVWMGYFELSYGGTRTVTLVWKVPSAVSKNQSGWRYQYVVQKQAGNLWKLNLQIELPTCAVITNKWGGLTSSNDKQQAARTQSLTEDMNVGADYACR
jgi:Protein of unknown function (DUF4012)